MPTLNDDISHAFIGHAVDIDRVGADLQGRVILHLQDLENDIVGRLAQHNITAYQRTRLETFLAQTRATINKTFTGVAELQRGHLQEIAKVSDKAVGRLVDDAFNSKLGLNESKTVQWHHTSTSAADLEKLVDDTMIQGAPQKAWWAKQSKDLQLNFTRQMRLGISQGETIDDLVKRVRGTKTGTKRVITVDGKKHILDETTGGVMSTSKHRAAALVRTSVHTVSQKVAEESFKKNKDVIKGIAVIVTLDGRTTMYCRSISGGAWDWDGNPLPNSDSVGPYPGPPPYHFNCRTVLSPVTYSWSELIENAQKESQKESTTKEEKEDVARAKKQVDALNKVEETPKARASMDGEVPAETTYSDWLKMKDAEEPGFAQELLGPTRYKLWKSGKLSFTDMVNNSGNPLNIKDLEAKAEQKTATAALTRAKSSFVPDDKIVDPAVVKDENAAYYQTTVDALKEQIDKGKIATASYYAVKSYTGHQYHKINEGLRGEGTLTAAQKAMVATIAQVIAVQPRTKNDLVVYRFVSSRAEHAINDIIEDAAFTSTGLYPNLKRGDEGYEIFVPKGTPGALQGINKTEQEVLFGTDVQFKVIGKRTLKIEERGGRGAASKEMVQLIYVGKRD